MNESLSSVAAYLFIFVPKSKFWCRLNLSEICHSLLWCLIRKWMKSGLFRSNINDVWWLYTFLCRFILVEDWTGTYWATKFTDLKCQHCKQETQVRKMICLLVFVCHGHLHSCLSLSQKLCVPDEQQGQNVCTGPV